VAIWGFGREGRAALAFIRENYPHLDPTILNDAPLTEEAGPLPPIRAIHGEAVADALRAGHFDLVIKSPGISLYRPEIADAKRRGVRFTSATNLWFALNATAKTIVITGTKGKSTTARLVHHLLERAGLDVLIVGNVGIPALGQPAAKDYSILELSSYQIADLEHAPDVALVTNLFPEHAPWHRGVEQYFRDKLRILTLGARTTAIVNYADERLRARLSHRPDVHWFNAASGFRASGGTLYYNDAPVDCSGFPLKGEHNVSNLAAGCTVADLVGIHVVRSAVDVRTFQQLHHRLEEFRVGPGLLCVDDSIATVPEATMAALEAYPRQDVVLLLGGSDRGQDHSALLNVLPRTRVRSLILLPPSGERLFAELSARSWPFEVVRAGNLEGAVKQGMSRVPADGLLLLSPAAPSFGEFRNFEERGNAFKVLCRAHAGLIGLQQGNGESADPRYHPDRLGSAVAGGPRG
jgi:UDP-N-acetylmuramoylalanine--D-glutamate ligase